MSLLKKRISGILHRLRGVSLFKYEEVKGTASFKMPPLTSSGTGKIIIHDNENEDDFIKVKTSRLDDFIDSFNNVKLISIDTEGHEPFVLEGIKEVIAKNRPVIIIEVSPKLLRKFANSTPQHIYSFFEELKYCVHRINFHFLISQKVTVNPIKQVIGFVFRKN